MLSRRQKHILLKFFSLFSVVRGYNILVVVIAQYLASVYIFAPNKPVGAVLFDMDDDDSHVRVALVGTVAVPGPVNADDEMVAAAEDAVWRTLVVFVQDAIVCYETDRHWGLVFFEVAWVLVVRFPSSYWRWPRLGLRNTMVFEAPPPQFPDEK